MSSILGIEVCLRAKPSMIGIAIREFINYRPKINPQTGQTEFTEEAMVAVCWEDVRSPAIHYHKANELEWLAIPGFTEDDEDEEDFEDDEFEGEEELSADDSDFIDNGPRA